MDQWISYLKNFVPWVSLLVGIGGSFHCIGMCGGLVSSSCHNKSDIGKYQVGRLLGYLLLGIIAAAIGSYFKEIIKHPILSYVPTFLVGGLFIYWGLMSFLGKSVPTPQSKYLSTTYQSLWKKFIFNNSHFTRSFLVGFLSILLPCGLLYGVILGAIAMQDITLAVLSIVFFWFGTLPAMVIAPEIFRKIVRPFQQYRPKLYALTLMMVGVMTISYRFYVQHTPSLEHCQCHTKTP